MLLASAALALTAGCGDSAADAARPTEVALHDVDRRDLRVTVSEKGSLRASRQQLVRADIPGQAKIVSIIDEGSVVEKGDILCELDRTQVEKEIETLENRVIALRGAVTAAEAELAIQISQNEADIAEKQLQLRFAGIELKRFEEGEFVEEETKRRIRVEEAESSLERAKRNYEHMPALLKEGFVTEVQVEEERIKKVKAEGELELARVDQKTYLGYTAPKELEQRKSDERKFGLELDRAKQRAKARRAQKQSDLDRQNNEFTNVQAELEEARRVLTAMTVRAPGPGIVIFGDARNPWDDREIKVGETVYSGNPFLTLPDLTEMQVVVAIHEADISKLDLGQQAFVTVETSRDTPLEGRVTKVAQVANSRGRRWSDRTKRFNVEISLQGDISKLELKPGLTASVEILVNELKSVLAVPAQAVFSEGGKFFVFRHDGNLARRHEVEITAGNSAFVVIEKGLDTGDRILLYNPESVSDVGGGAGAGGGGGKTPKPSAPSGRGKP